MAANATLTAKGRDGQGKGDNRKLRQTGYIPAVIYGHGEQTRSVAVNAHELELLFSRVHVENTVIDLNVEGEKKPIRALVPRGRAQCRGEVALRGKSGTLQVYSVKL